LRKIEKKEESSITNVAVFYILWSLYWQFFIHTKAH